MRGSHHAAHVLLVSHVDPCTCCLRGALHTTSALDHAAKAQARTLCHTRSTSLSGSLHPCSSMEVVCSEVPVKVSSVPLTMNRMTTVEWVHHVYTTVRQHEIQRRARLDIVLPQAHVFNLRHRLERSHFALYSRRGFLRSHSRFDSGRDVLPTDTSPTDPPAFVCTLLTDLSITAVPRHRSLHERQRGRSKIHLLVRTTMSART